VALGIGAAVGVAAGEGGMGWPLARCAAAGAQEQGKRDQGDDLWMWVNSFHGCFSLLVA